MSNIRILLLCLSFSFCFVAMAPPRHRIINIVNKNSLTSEEIKLVTQYATGWAEALDTTDTTELFSARRRLIGPLSQDADMSPYVRSMYSKGVINGVSPLLDPSNTNEMGLVNALQVLSVIGSEQTSRKLLSMADVSGEKRDSARLWASIGLGKSFRAGVIPSRKLLNNARRLQSCISIEPKWFVIVEQFSALAALQNTMNIDSTGLRDHKRISLELQTKTINSFVNSLRNSPFIDEKFTAMSMVLPSLRIQLSSPLLDSTERNVARKELVEPLCEFVTISVERVGVVKDNDVLFNAYGQAINAAGLIVDRYLELDDDARSSLMDLWKDNNTPAILDRVAQWKSSIKK